MDPRGNLEKAEYFLIFLGGLGKTISSIRIEFLACQRKNFQSYFPLFPLASSSVSSTNNLFNEK